MPIREPLTSEPHISFTALIPPCELHLTGLRGPRVLSVLAGLPETGMLLICLSEPVWVLNNTAGLLGRWGAALCRGEEQIGFVQGAVPVLTDPFLECDYSSSSSLLILCFFIL